MDWIRTIEQLPPEGVRVLALDKWSHVKDRKLRTYQNGEKYFTPDGLKPGKDVTHWMPLPELEKEEQK